MRNLHILWGIILVSIIGISLFMARHLKKVVVEGHGGGGGGGRGGRGGGGHGRGGGHGGFGRRGYYGASRGFNYGGYGGALSYDVNPLYLDSPYEDVYYGYPTGYVFPTHIFTSEGTTNLDNHTYDQDINEIYQPEVMPVSSLEMLENM
jgi:hypothetical protein